MEPQHRIGSREEWLAASRALLADEKAHMRAGDELARKRRELPWVKVDKVYTFDTPEGRKTLAELFDGRSQLIVYHFMGGAQPLAATMAGFSMIAVECDETRIDFRLKTRYVDKKAKTLDEALAMLDEAKRAGKPISVGLLGNAADVFAECVARGITPDCVTDQTSAHDPIHGYLPQGWTVGDWRERMMTFSASYLKLMLSGQREFSEEFVRGVEAVTGLPGGWMNVPHTGQEIPPNAREAIDNELPLARFRGTAHPVRKKTVLRPEPIFGQPPPARRLEEETLDVEAHRRHAHFRKVRDLATQEVRRFERHLLHAPVELASMRAKVEDVMLKKSCGRPSRPN